MSLSQRIAWAIATTFGLGDRLPAPGTSAGSAPASALFFLGIWLIPGSIHPAWWLGLALAIGIPVAIWAADSEEARRGEKDPGAVVADEVVGQWLTFFVALPWLVGLETPLGLAKVCIAGFLLFRAFDIFKPPPVRQLESLGGGFGITVDDLAAGIYAGIALALVAPYLS